MRYPDREVLTAVVVILAVIAVITVAVALLAGDREPSRYIGLDRSVAACAQIESPIPFTRQHCIANGRPFLCVREYRSNVWQCARIGAQAAEAQ